MEYKAVNTKFPTNPKHGDLYEVKTGLLYQYDAGVNGWLEIRSDNLIIELATPIKKGAMSADDLKKLNRLLLPPPQATITGTDCPTPFQYGVVQLLSGDRFVDVDGNVNIRNINEFGDVVSESHPFHIHQHTYGFDFTLDIPELVNELIARGRLNLQGVVGDKGDKGDTGDDGVNKILSGPPGTKGDQGLAPPCDLVIDPEPINAEARPGLKRALVTARLIDNSDNTFVLEFDRQVVGSQALSTASFNVRDSDSFWVLAVTSITVDPQPIYYIDIEPLIEIVHSKFLSEVDRLKKGYEDIVEFWVQTMSDLFDEQKAALCCALEYCMSATKSIDQRWHMESVAAAVVGSKGARINLHGRNSNEAVEVSSTSLLPRLPDGKDLCKDTPPVPPPPPLPDPDDDSDYFVQVEYEGIIADNFDPIEDNFPCATTIQLYTRLSSSEGQGSIEKRGKIIRLEAKKDGCFETVRIPFSELFPVPTGMQDRPRSIAIGPNVRFTITTGRNANEGNIFFDGTGPLIVYKSYGSQSPADDFSREGCDGEPVTFKNAYGSLLSRDWNGKSPNGFPLNSVFPPSVRTTDDFVQWSELSVYYEDGKCKIPDRACPWVIISCVKNSGRSGQTPQIQAFKSTSTKTLIVDPLVNVSNTKVAAKIELTRGRYTAIISNMDTRISNKYGYPLKIQHVENGNKKIIQFLDKGRFDTLDDAKNAYEGLALTFNHDGGLVYFYYPMIPNQDVSGSSTISIELSQELSKETFDIADSGFSCSISRNHFNQYYKLSDDNCCGIVVNVSGQDYIIIKRMDDEIHDVSCVSAAFEKFGQYPAFAWPTFDKKSFAPLSDDVRFIYDESVNDIVLQKIDDGQYMSIRSGQLGHRYLSNQLSLILFPAY